MTLEEYLNTPETVFPAELAFGVLKVADAPLPRHQRAVADFFRALDGHVRERALGEVWLAPIDVILDAELALVVQPDLLFISKARGDILQDRIRGAPDMVLEVLSPHPRVGRIDRRIGWFARYGVEECWVCDQLARRLEVLTFKNGAVAARASFDEATRVRSAVFPAFDRTLGSILTW